ncbi:MAG TPA: YdcF family protein [Stellaceae bacterium]|nr:YdcF family protein [Stellaceae bacterium]
MTRRLKSLAILAAGCAGLWLGGLMWFVHEGLSVADHPAERTDAIVVLTGGRLRLESAVDLFGEGKAQKLFISGVNHHVDREALMRVFEPVASRAQCCIVLGHDADNTLGNARETAQWMRQERYASLRLVTSWYHMPRSLIEFHRAMPDVEIVASPVFARPEPGENRLTAWSGATGLTIGEYHKFLAVWLRTAAETVWPGLMPPPGPDLPEKTATAAALRRQ